MSKLKDIYFQAREHLQISQKKVAKLAGVSSGVLTGLESGSVKNPNYKYTKYLVEQGINPFYLLGLSDEIEGDLIEMVGKKKYETLKSEYENLRLENENLEKQVSEMVSRSEFEEVVQENQILQKVLKMLQIEADEDGNLKKKR